MERCGNKSASSHHDHGHSNSPKNLPEDTHQNRSRRSPNRSLDLKAQLLHEAPQLQTPVGKNVSRCGSLVRPSAIACTLSRPVAALKYRSLGCVSAVDSNGRTIWIADA